MLSVEEFILDYLIGFTEQFGEREKYCAPFYEKYFTANLMITYRQAIDHKGLKRDFFRYQQAKSMVKAAAIVEFLPVIISVDVQGESAIIITSEQGSWESEYKRHRYHLLNTTAGWRIDRKGTACLFCIGPSMDNIGKGEICFFCRGLGWRYSGASK